MKIDSEEYNTVEAQLEAAEMTRDEALADFRKAGDGDDENRARLQFVLARKEMAVRRLIRRMNAAS